MVTCFAGDFVEGRVLNWALQCVWGLWMDGRVDGEHKTPGKGLEGGTLSVYRECSGSLI